MANELSELLPKTGVLSANSWSFPASMTQDDWKGAGFSIARVEGAMNWWLGDWWNYGCKAYGDRKEMVESDDWQGPSYNTCANVAYVASTFQSSRRRELVTFGHHAECTSLPEAEQDTVLDWCEKMLKETGRLPTRLAVRDYVKQIKAWLAQGWNQSQLERREKLQLGFTVVANLSNDPVSGRCVDAALIAWADQQGLVERIDRMTPWGNPFELPADGNRETVCDNFEQHYFPHKPSLHKKLTNLKGKVLTCWCYPKRCHGDHLAEKANDSH
jgi:hypothetical protein